MPLWLAAKPLVLASRSSVRHKLLEAAGVPVETHPADLDERALESRASSSPPGEIVKLLAREKALSVACSQPGRLVLGADQILALGGKRFSKPVDRAGARAQLRALAGQTHELHSAIAFVQDGTVLFAHVDEARLTMRPFTDRFLGLYLEAAGSAVTASVGAYQIEGVGIQLFERLEGDYFGILGLPLIAVLDFLRRGGYFVS